MSGKNKTVKTTYSIPAIIDCIIADNEHAQSLTVGEKHRLYSRAQERLLREPALRSVLSLKRIRSLRIDGAHNFARIGVLPPEAVILDQRFRDMCALPFWTVYRGDRGEVFKKYGPCPGLNNLPCCPPYSADIEKTQAVLDDSSLFVVLQTRLISERWNNQWRYSVLHRLAHDIRAVCGHDSVRGQFGAGPCEACSAQTCRYGRPCSAPKLQLPSLESLGVCVDRVCSDLALLTGNRSWKLRWLRHFGFQHQTPRQWKYVIALAVQP